MTPAGAAEAAPRRFPLFDSLRAFAALSVFASHLPFAARLAQDSVVRDYLLVLNVGVAVFFLISGFLLYRPFAQARYEKWRAPSAGPYAVRRILRIGPAYWVALPFVVLLVGPSGEAAAADPVFSFPAGIYYFGFLQVYYPDTLLGGISAAWTLCVEASFYALLPAWAWLMRHVPSTSRGSFLRTELAGLALLFCVGLGWSSIAAWQANVTAALFVDVTQIDPWLYVLPAYLDHFALGMGLAVLSVGLSGLPRRPGPIRLIEQRPILAVAAAALAFVLLGQAANWFPDRFGVQFVTTHVLQGAFAFALILPAVFGPPERGFVRRLMANRALLWIGLVSYGVYLWHAAVIRELFDRGVEDALGGLGFTLTCLAVTLLVAAASFYGVERHALRLGRRLSRRRRSEDADVRMRDLPRHERPEAGVP